MRSEPSDDGDDPDDGDADDGDDGRSGSSPDSVSIWDVSICGVTPSRNVADGTKNSVPVTARLKSSKRS
jgi:hypothetical protein